MQISKTIPLSDPRISHMDGRQSFLAAQHAMLDAWRAWLEMQPDRCDVEQEMQASIEALWGIATTVAAQRLERAE